MSITVTKNDQGGDVVETRSLPASSREMKLTGSIPEGSNEIGGVTQEGRKFTQVTHLDRGSIAAGTTVQYDIDCEGYSRVGIGQRQSGNVSTDCAVSWSDSGSANSDGFLGTTLWDDDSSASKSGQVDVRMKTGRINVTNNAASTTTGVTITSCRMV